MNYNASANTDFNGLLCTYAILGCTDSTAFNYNINANVDDGSCQPIVFGCTDNTAFNYNSEANIDDGSCIDLVLGCTDPNSVNYNSLANTDDDSCIPFIYGCTDENALNYNLEANTDDGTCIDAIYGCTDQEAANYDYLANIDDDSCLYEGCTDDEALNFNPEADIDDGSCEIPGCIWNYWFICPSSVNPDATVGDWSYCEYIWGGCSSGLVTIPDEVPLISIDDIPGNTIDLNLHIGDHRIGCMDSSANNYSKDVVVDNGSCNYLNIMEHNDDFVKVFPIPATDKIFIDLNNLNSIKEISILDLNQKIVYNYLKPEKGTIELNISNIDSGIYFVLIETEKDKIVKKIIKE